MEEKMEKTRFFKVSSEELKAFQIDVETFNLTKTPLEMESLIDEDSYQFKELRRKFESIDFKFVFSGLSGCGKTVLNLLLHQITKKPIVSVDLVVEMEIAKNCREKGLKSRDEFMHWANTNYPNGYRQWKNEVIISCIDTSIKYDTLLELGSYDVLVPQIRRHIKLNNVSNIYLHVDKGIWMEKSLLLKESRSNFRKAWEMDKTHDKSEYHDFCEKFFTERIDEYPKFVDKTIIRDEDNLISTLNQVLMILSRSSRDRKYHGCVII